MGTRTRFIAGAAALALAVPVLLSGCSPHPADAAATGSRPAALAADLAAADVTITPTIHPAKVPVTTEIGATVVGGVLTDVQLTDAQGQTVAGALRSDGLSWVPAGSLRYDEHYTATIMATSATGVAKTATTSFTTMSKPPGRPITTTVSVSNKATYGVAMPIVVTFSAAIPAKDRAGVERRLFVASSPPQMGIWAWQSSTQVAFRPQQYWPTGTSVTLSTELAGMPIGNRPLGPDHSASFTIGKDLQYAVNTRTHMLTITSDGAVIHRFPISSGKASTPSWSGKFVIMTKQYYTVFNTLGIPGENYVTAVHYAERLTLSGTFFHSAPWSVGAQGHANVSHGCINLAPQNAKWIYHHGQVGDPVAVTGTRIHAAQGNGWTMWDMSWSEFVKGSAVGFAQATSALGARPEL